MKASYNLSKWSWIVTFVLFAVAFIGFIPEWSQGRRDPATVSVFALVFGLLAQIILGIIHAGMAIYAYSQYKKLQKNEQVLLNVYSIFVGAFFAAWLLIAQQDLFGSDDNLIGFIIVFPMSIGAYFVFVMYRINGTYKAEITKSALELTDK